MPQLEKKKYLPYLFEYPVYVDKSHTRNKNNSSNHLDCRHTLLMLNITKPHHYAYQVKYLKMKALSQVFKFTPTPSPPTSASSNYMQFSPFSHCCRSKSC